ncbi:MAG: hypothetical protein GC129_01600 [Proteobacteria bacterium]|nr:hypothetical protein [Pseudomonadota bacterium]
MPKSFLRFPPSPLSRTALGGALGLALLGAQAALASPPPVVPGYVAPVTETPVQPYVDDTRGVYVPAHTELRAKTEGELADWKSSSGDQYRPLYAQKNPGGQQYEQALNTMANGVPDTQSEIARIGQDPGLLAGGGSSGDDIDGMQMAQNTKSPRSLEDYPSLATGGAPAAAGRPAAPAQQPMAAQPMPITDGGQELAIGATPTASAASGVDFQHGIVRLKEERISVRRALQRMMDQLGAGTWAVVWDLDESNAGLPDMEISIYAEEPFVKVLNALLARLQTRSGQPLRVIKYENTQRLVITDRVGGDSSSASVGIGGKAPGGADVAVTESVLKDSMISIHYDEIPLVDALENIVNQAGKGQWRLRMYAGTDQVLKPAHVEEPFGTAIERILKIFGLRYEIFPGGKLIVVTGADRFGFRGVQ